MVVDDSSRDVVTFRLERLERGQQDLAARAIAPELYARDRAELERRISDLETELEQERQARREAARAMHARIDQLDKDCKERVEKAEKALTGRMDRSGTNWRQSLFQGVLPVLLALLTIATAVLLAMRSTGK